MAAYRLGFAAQADIVEILAWSHERFGEEARLRYEKLLAAAMRDAASSADVERPAARPEGGPGVFSWHLARSRTRSSGGPVHRPRHFLVCRRDGGLLVIGRVLHDSMDTPRHRDGAWTGEEARDI
ncbi:type II toxin-antitoxin system RelE/ParE family toxin [Arthrobacter sp.]|uniref:type II toxin-antitoxin system RelE/ParE family toxin n=1 Tax=Arthrobacter sp. TaxID=1667 RepID=UPI003A95CBE9